MTTDKPIQPDHNDNAQALYKPGDLSSFQHKFLQNSEREEGMPLGFYFLF